jgi:hypothetical protein
MFDDSTAFPQSAHTLKWAEHDAKPTASREYSRNIYNRMAA